MGKLIYFIFLIYDMLFKKRLIISKFDLRFCKDVSIPIRSKMILIRDISKCSDCKFNSSYGLECRYWNIYYKYNHILPGRELLRFCINYEITELGLSKNKNFKFRYKLHSIK